MSGISKKAVIELSKKGSRLFRSGQLEDAEKAYLEAKELDADNPYVLSGLGDVYRVCHSPYVIAKIDNYVRSVR